MCDKSQIKTSILNAAKGKINRGEVKLVIVNLQEHVDTLYELLVSHSYVPSVPKHKTIWDKCGGKERIISMVPFFPDACIQRLAVDVVKDSVFMSHMYPHSCASIPKRGGKHAKDYFEKALKCKRHTKYAVKVDIKKYYPSIRSEIVMKKLERKIKDKDYLNLIYSIITCDPDEPGLAIGFYINQWLANFILEDIDWKVHSSTGVRYYARNMDDMVLVGSNKRDLERAVKKIERNLKYMHLELKPNHNVFTIDEIGLDFVGYRFFHGYTLLRRRNSLRLMRRIHRISKKQKNGEYISRREAAGLLSLLGQLKNVVHHKFNKKYVSMIDRDALVAIVNSYPRGGAIYGY